MRRRLSPVLAPLGALAVAALLAGCTASTPPEPTASTPVAPPSASAEPGGPSGEPEPGSDPDPELVPDGSDADNAPFAQAVVQRAADAADGSLTRNAIAAALADAGFAADALEVTPDRTPLGLEVDVISFAVRIGDDCIVGELRSGAATATTASVLGTGRCLVGSDASIG